jgi:hypothetical protein
MPRSFPCRSLGSVIVWAFGLAVAWPGPADAQHAVALESPAFVNDSLVTLVSTSEPFDRTPPPSIGAVALPPAGHAEPAVPGRPPALPALYVSFAALQALDVHSTMTAVEAGRSEANPAIKELVRQPAAFVAAKVVATAATLYISERLWRRHRVAAVVLMVAVNGAYGAIVARNYRR